MSKIVTLAFAGTVAATLAGLGIAAASPSVGIVLDNGKPIDFVHGNAAPATPAVAPPGERRAIYENFANLYPLGEYNASTGAALSGPNTLHGQIWLAASFTPARTTTLKEVEVAAEFINGTRNVVAVALYADASGVPGTELWSRKTALPTFPSCCAVVALTDRTGVPVTAGTRYWLGITTLRDASDTSAAWNLVVKNQVKGGLAAQNRGGGWQAGPSVPFFAFGVYGE
jgi:hypothetical protein